MTPCAASAASRPGPAAADAPAALPEPPAELVTRRAELARQFADLQWDLGGLAYEMAIRDYFKLDVLARKAAELQVVDAELGELDRLLRTTEGVAGACTTAAPPIPARRVLLVVRDDAPRRRAGCDQRARPMTTCPGCAAPAHDDQRYCLACGARLAGAPELVTEAPAAPPRPGGRAAPPACPGRRPPARPRSACSPRASSWASGSARSRWAAAARPGRPCCCPRRRRRLRHRRVRGQGPRPRAVGPARLDRTRGAVHRRGARDGHGRRRRVHGHPSHARHR